MGVVATGLSLGEPQHRKERGRPAAGAFVRGVAACRGAKGGRPARMVVAVKVAAGARAGAGRFQRPTAVTRPAMMVDRERSASGQRAEAVFRKGTGGSLASRVANQQGWAAPRLRFGSARWPEAKANTGGARSGVAPSNGARAIEAFGPSQPMSKPAEVIAERATGLAGYGR